MKSEVLHAINGNLIGVLWENGVLCIERNFRKHLLYSMGNAIAIDAKAWDSHNTRIKMVECKDTHSGQKYRISAAQFERMRRSRHHGEHGPQYGVPLKYWKCDAEESAQPALL